jgi:hydroxymethylglutaryl-CoA lyase
MRVRNHVNIREVGPREALQADHGIVATEVKVELIRKLLASGVKSINAVSFVGPKAMPHMADAEAVLEGLGRVDGVIISALAPNERGVLRAIAMAEAGLLDEVHLLHAASEEVLKANGIMRSLEERLEEVIGNAEAAHAKGLRTVVFISASFGCSIKGEIDPRVVIDITRKLYESPAVNEMVISDSTGQADPRQISEMLTTIADLVDDHPISVHLHDSRGAGLANALAALDSPVQNLTIDTSFGGLGGDVPFIPEAAGNVSTEDLVEMLEGMGTRTGIDVRKVLEACEYYQNATGRQLQSRLPIVGPVRWKRERVA